MTTPEFQPARRFPGEVKALVSFALSEDIGSGDITSELLSSFAPGEAEIITRQRICLAGSRIAARVFHELDPNLRVRLLFEDGQSLEAGERVLAVSGPRCSILTAERTALNFLGRMCGVATLTRRYVDAVEGSGVQIVDTRKTIPGWRWLDKYAVRAGGGVNHRIGLYDGIMVKDNHVDALGGMASVVDLFRRIKPSVPLSIECRNLDEALMASSIPPNLIMLDNLKSAQIREIVQALEGRCPIEATGGVDLETVVELAQTGVQRISIGRLTHSAPAADLSLQWMEG